MNKNTQPHTNDLSKEKQLLLFPLFLIFIKKYILFHLLT